MTLVLWSTNHDFCCWGSNNLELGMIIGINGHDKVPYSPPKYTEVAVTSVHLHTWFIWVASILPRLRKLLQSTRVHP